MSWVKSIFLPTQKQFNVVNSNKMTNSPEVLKYKNKLANKRNTLRSKILFFNHANPATTNAKNAQK
jgi:hypothetical protein